MQQRMAPMVAGAVLGLAALGVTGCGSSSSASASASASSNGEQGKPAQQVFTDAKAALAAAPSVHVQGSNTDENGQQEQIDAHFQGSDSDVTVTEAAVTVHLVRAGGTTYVNAPAAFWQQQPASAAAAPKLADKWIVASTSPSSDDITLQSLADDLSSADSPLQPAVAAGSVDGQRTVVLTQQDGSTLDVAATGQPVPLRAVNKGSNAGTLTFTDYGKGQKITAPQGALTAQQAAQGAAG